MNAIMQPISVIQMLSVTILMVLTLALAIVGTMVMEHFVKYSIFEKY